MISRSSVIDLLHLLEERANDNRPSAWMKLRNDCYIDLRERMLTTSGFSDYSKFYPRIIGLMAAAHDWDVASEFLSEIAELRASLETACNTAEKGSEELSKVFAMIARRMREASLGAVTKGTSEVKSLLEHIAIAVTPGHEAIPAQASPGDIRRQAESLQAVDWARTPYWMRWITSRRTPSLRARIRHESLEKLLPIDIIRQLAKAAELDLPYWPALAFPTRPMPLKVIRDLEIKALPFELPDHQSDLVVQGATGFLPKEHLARSAITSGYHSSDYEPPLDIGSSWPLSPRPDLEKLAQNAYFRVPPTNKINAPLKPGGAEFFVQFAQAEFDVPGEDGVIHQSWQFDGMEVSWLDTPQGQSGWLSDLELIEYYQRLPLVSIELEISDPDLEKNELLQNVSITLDEGSDPGGWYRMKVSPAPEKDYNEGKIPGTLSHNLFQAGTNINLDDIAPVKPADRDKLNSLVVGDRVDELDEAEIERILGPVSISWAVVYDVGQGNCIGLCEPNGSVSAYFDFGGGAVGHANTFPDKALKKFCLTKQPPIILSHWDKDHWSSAYRDGGTQALASEWILPRQDLTLAHVNLLAAIDNAGGKAWFLPNSFKSHCFGHLQLEVCTGNNRNNGGIAITVSERDDDETDGRGEKILMPGDADYKYISSFKGSSQYLSIVVPHHGGVLKSKTLPTCPGRSASRLVYSYGKGNSYEHPRDETVQAHKESGWCGKSTLETASRTSAKLGHVLLVWQVQSDLPNLPCGGQSCQLKAQQS